MSQAKTAVVDRFATTAQTLYDNAKKINLIADEMDDTAKQLRQADNLEADLLKIAEGQLDGYISECPVALDAIAAHLDRNRRPPETDHDWPSPEAAASAAQPANPAAAPPANRAPAAPKAVQIWTDGSCLGNPGPGGGAAIIADAAGNIIARTAFSNPDTTNNRMELQAVINGILLAAEPQVCDGRRTDAPVIAFGTPVVVHTDSRYVSDAVNKGWLGKWQRNGWRTAKRQPVENQDLWQDFLKIRNEDWYPNLTIAWVPGHAGHPLNEAADRAAHEQAARVAAR